MDSLVTSFSCIKFFWKLFLKILMKSMLSVFAFRESDVGAEILAPAAKNPHLAATASGKSDADAISFQADVTNSVAAVRKPSESRGAGLSLLPDASSSSCHSSSSSCFQQQQKLGEQGQRSGCGDAPAISRMSRIIEESVRQDSMDTSEGTCRLKGKKFCGKGHFATKNLE
jgi:hypothetical protein